jgi:serine/threonine protein kinase
MNETVFVKPIGYRLVEFLGEGLNSCVYKAIKELPDQNVYFQVALKILKSEKLVEVWRNEFERLSSIKSQNCVQLLGWEIINDMPTLVLEYVDGPNLNELLANTKLTPQLLQEILVQSYRGLKDLDKAGLYHGDLNLNNIMINSSGEVKLIDFGVSGGAGCYMTTPMFASAEVLSGARPDHRADLHSLKSIGVHLAKLANCRVCHDFEIKASSPIAKAELSKVVQQILLKKQKRQGFTQKISQIKNKHRVLASSIRASSFLALFLLSLVSQGDQRLGAHENGYGYISLRTTSWAKVLSGDGREYYAPADFYVSADGPIQLRWVTQDGVGQTSLTVNKGQHIVLDDEYFKRQK